MPPAPPVPPVPPDVPAAAGPPPATLPPPQAPVRERMAVIQQLTTALHQADDDSHSLHVALACAVEGIARMDFEDRYVWVNPAYCTIAGRLPDDLIGRRAEDVDGIVDPADADRLRQAALAMLRDGRSKVDVRGTRAGGATYWKQITMVPAADRLGRFVGHFRFVHDITHRKANEEHMQSLARALAEKDRRYRMLVQSAPDAVVACGRDGLIHTWNDAAVRLFGWTTVQALGMPVTALVPPATRAAHGAAFAAAVAAPPVAGGRHRVLRADAVRRDGVTFPVEVALSVWDDDPADSLFPPPAGAAADAACGRTCTAFVREDPPPPAAGGAAQE